MRIDPASHLIAGGCYVPSPNADDRPDHCCPSLIVIHGISLPPGQFGGPYIRQLFTNRLDPGAHPSFAPVANQRVSAHVLIERNGRIVQFVPFHRRAWHAGVSSYKGKENCNDFSIGIELEGTDQLPYEDVQYGVLATLIDTLRIVYPSLSKESISGHSEIAPDRKTDPGPAFDWQRLHRALA